MTKAKQNLQSKTAKLKPITIKLRLVSNPEWKKQVAIVKKEVEKLNKMPVLIVNEG